MISSNLDLNMQAEDRDTVYLELFRKKQRQYLRSVIDDALIEEHRRAPRGQHREPLERLLIYFRTAPQKNKYVIKRDAHSGKYRVAQLTGERDEPIREVSPTGFDSLDEVQHEIFLRRVRDLWEADS
jgi:branched-chain amino acid transport system permease protein